MREPRSEMDLHVHSLTSVVSPRWGRGSMATPPCTWSFKNLSAGRAPLSAVSLSCGRLRPKILNGPLPRHTRGKFQVLCCAEQSCPRGDSSPGLASPWYVPARQSLRSRLSDQTDCPVEQCSYQVSLIVILCHNLCHSTHAIASHVSSHILEEEG